MSGVTFIYAGHASHNTLADHGWRLDPLGEGGGGRGLAIDVFELSGGRSRTPDTTSQGTRLLVVVKPNRIIRKNTDANCSSFHLRVFL
jgi:hypothetical protein